MLAFQSTFSSYPECYGSFPVSNGEMLTIDRIHQAAVCLIKRVFAVSSVKNHWLIAGNIQQKETLKSYCNGVFHVFEVGE